MINKKNTVNSIVMQRHQRGVVLIVALIMLLLLTIIGVAGIRDTQLQEKMAGGAQDRELALQAAEAALRVAESQLVGGACSGGCAASGYIAYSINNAGVMVTTANSTGVAAPSLNRVATGLCGAACDETLYWQTFYPWLNGTHSTAAPAIPGVVTPPRYVIEKLPAEFSAVPGTANSIIQIPVPKPIPAGFKTITDFLITARGTGAAACVADPCTTTAVVILQSMYRFSN